MREKGVPANRPETPDAPFVVPWYHWLWVAPSALMLRLWLSTLRFRSDLDRFDDADGPSVVLHGLRTAILDSAARPAHSARRGCVSSTGRPGIT